MTGPSPPTASRVHRRSIVAVDPRIMPALRSLSEQRVWRFPPGSRAGLPRCFSRGLGEKRSTSYKPSVTPRYDAGSRRQHQGTARRLRASAAGLIETHVV